MGAAKAKLVTFAADGAPWIWARLDWVIAQAKLDPARVVEVLDWCHGVHHLSLALTALDLTADQRQENYSRLRRLLKNGESKAVLAELEQKAAHQLSAGAQDQPPMGARIPAILRRPETAM